ncbi:hypothetical protein MCOR25_002068 [Pyricularia grisea]|nr:hypothetical protein MCOR25_002068 [Pyricularia grisea]
MTVTNTIISSGYQKRFWVETPLLQSHTLSQASGCNIFLKLENLQPSGSFKSRGIGNYLLQRLSELPIDAPKPHVVTSSGGNAGLAAVHAARNVGLPCTVVVPLLIKPLMIEKLRAAGAHEVLRHGATWQETDDYVRLKFMAKSEVPTIYVPPFDHPDVWTGHSTMVHEVAKQMPTGTLPDAIICSVGGGGLLNGVCQGLDDVVAAADPGRPKPIILAVETEGADSLNASVKAGELVELPGITSLATSLGAKKVTRKTLEYAQQGHVRSHVLTDSEAAMGCWKLADDERLLVELACGVSVSLCYGGRLEKALGRKVKAEDNVVIVLCGGSNITVEMLREYRDMFEGQAAVAEHHSST